MIKNLIILVLAVTLVAVGFKVYKPKDTVKTPNVETLTPVVKASMNPYSNPLQNYSFQYPPNLYLKEKVVTESNLHSSVILVESTKENRDVIDGVTSSARDWPTSIIIDVYDNKNNYSPSDWVFKETNWVLSNDTGKTVSVNSVPTYFYSYDALYPGKTYVFAANTKAYVLSVNWLTTDDQIIRDFDMIINSFSLSK